MLLKNSLYRMAAVVGVWGVLQSAGAGTLQLQVQDKNGKPLPDAVVFLESAEAKAAEEAAAKAAEEAAAATKKAADDAAAAAATAATDAAAATTTGSVRLR